MFICGGHHNSDRIAVLMMVSKAEKYCIVSIILYYVYSRAHLIRPPSESHWCGRIRGMVAHEGFVYEQKALSVTRNVVV